MINTISIKNTKNDYYTHNRSGKNVGAKEHLKMINSRTKEVMVEIGGIFPELGHRTTDLN